jgi:hypothetical protein
MTARPLDLTHREHVHRRDWRPCPAGFPPPLRPTKRTAIWCFAFAEAVLHRETFAEFVATSPTQFPQLAASDLERVHR